MELNFNIRNPPSCTTTLGEHDKQISLAHAAPSTRGAHKQLSISRSLPCLRSVALTLALALLPTHCITEKAEAAKPSNARAVFAHYMVCFATYGATVEGYKREIKEAQAAGIDGFALNVGAWTNEPHYVRRTKLLFQAAQELGTGFTMIFSLDLATLQPKYIAEILKTYVNHPNFYRYKGRSLVSTFAGENVDWKSILQPLKTEGYNICFVPFFYPKPVTELPSYQAVKGHFARYADIADGYFFFGAAGTAEQLTECNTSYVKAAREANKLVMASYSPFYWGMAQPGRRYYETKGGKGIEMQWKSIIANQPNFVEIVTWNDFNESYLTPVDKPEQYFSGLKSPRRHSHVAYYELLKYFIPWYRTGKEPKIERDGLFYFYRVHPKSAVLRPPITEPATAKKLAVTVFHGDVTDTIYVTTLLKSPAELIVKTGDKEVKLHASEGYQSFEVPFRTGVQRFALVRKGKVIAESEGEPIVAEPTEYNFFPTTGFVYGK